MQDKIETFNQFLKDHLNTNQLKAVTQKNGTLLVIAGAGSGKTRVITARIANLMLNEEVQASQIIALTFTNKAAKEMKDRITNWLGNNEDIPFVGTFHSFCLRLLKQNSRLLEITNFTILDDDDQKKILNDIIKRNDLNKKISADQLAYQISVLKNNLALGNAAFSLENKILQELYLAYENQRKVSKCFDFDDLIIETLKLFKNNKDFKETFQNTIKHVLVDEYQDTSTIQHELLKQISLDITSKNKKVIVDSLCVVGDEDQSVYSWRGANVDNIVYFKKDFTDTTTIKIEQNYRSVKPILEIANKVIANNKNRNPKELWSNKEAKNRALVLSCMSEYQEGEMIANLAQTLSKQNKLNSMAVLYRAHYQSRAIEEALIKLSIPYKIIGGIQFYERKEIKDLLAYLKLFVNPYDRVSFFRVINCPPRRLGDKFEEEFYNYWDSKLLLDFKQVAKNLIDQKTLGKMKEDSLQSFLDTFDSGKPSLSMTGNTTNPVSLPVRQSLGDVGSESFDTFSTTHDKLRESNGSVLLESPTKALNYIIQKIQYFNYLQNNFDPNEAESKIENVKELLRAASHFEETGLGQVPEFLEQISLLKEKMQESKETDAEVKLMSLHAAKGLEFDNVVIAGLEDGIMPSNRSIQSEDAIEEERRLFYVGITRAREYLILSKVLYRKTFGQTSYQISSRFLDEVPEKLVQKHDCAYWLTNQFSDLFAQWLGFKTASSVHTFSKPKIEFPKEKLESKWRPNRTVKHKEFGLGIIQQVDDKGNGKYTITTRFGTGIKKISSDFLEII